MGVHFNISDMFIRCTIHFMSHLSLLFIIFYIRFPYMFSVHASCEKTRANKYAPSK
jgi:hypothetical protein